MKSPTQKTVIIAATLIVAIVIGIAVISYTPEKEYELPQFSAKSVEELIQIVETAYRDGKHYKIMAYMDLESISDDMAELWVKALSQGAGNKAKTSETRITPWEEFNNTMGLPGSYKGKELKYNHTPEGVLSIFSVSEGGRIKHQIYLAYYQKNGKYRICGTYYKK